MSLRTLPAAPTARSADVRSEAPVRALDRWVAGIAPRQAAEDAERSISILDVIGEDFWTGEGVTARRIAAALRQIGERDVIVNVNSPGGDFFEALAIYNLLREHPAKVTVRILGLAASAAATISMAGDEILVAKAGFVMVHETLWCACGHADDLRSVAEIMDTFDEVALDILADRSGLPRRRGARAAEGHRRRDLAERPQGRRARHRGRAPRRRRRRGGRRWAPRAERDSAGSRRRCARRGPAAARSARRSGNSRRPCRTLAHPARRTLPFTGASTGS